LAKTNFQYEKRQKDLEKKRKKEEKLKKKADRATQPDGTPAEPGEAEENLESDAEGGTPAEGSEPA
jgi:septal ring factor EnvC (AmiA/AmiB activator)